MHYSSSSMSGLNNVPMTEKTKQLADGILSQNRRALSRAITLVESRKPEHNKQAELLIDYVLEKRRAAAAASVKNDKENNNNDDNITPLNFKKSIRFDSIYFSYNKEKYVISNFNLEIFN